ncbi:uncharacterized protein K460DRAFT_396871 [Cucurbitaria berberidis CBS 394.84]|uniref:Actin-like ATPase domain-containing protein n=1 Tax=Cucurbitaria berberidis CBS 394.84 TaxID=1168544 RepID=A0A9P4L6R1_9PLEO|nr:uncharacterized protein K460DRAFT_396871 [Cucurbitaria berberidis CBS 394.84]KAF1843607.1 hypothetical protein K460DRAFT_396871 [Cucurbitaria berberidis CBS 394.84]
MANSYLFPDNARTQATVKGDYQNQPLEFYGTPPPPPMPVELPPSPPSPHFDIPSRRPPPYALGAPARSSNSRYPSVALPQSPHSSHTSYSAIDLDRRHINIGIDFGTTYSGVSWAISGTHYNDVNTVDNWPNGDHHVKVPTEITYDKGVVQWGYSIPPDAERLSWFKLLLAENKLPPKVRESKQLQSTKKLLQKLNKTEVDVTSDYLQRLWLCALEDIRRQIPNSIDGMPFRIILSVPAKWPKEARDKMHSAAQKAGLLSRQGGGLETKLEFVGEPEAAAIAAFFEGNVRHNIKVGDIVVICDAGGGTVDIVTYEVDQVEPSINLGECIGGDMDLCGSIFLDEGFVKHIEGLIGKEKVSKLPKETYRRLVKAWDQSIKCQFDNDTPEIATPIPHEVAKAIKSPLLRFKKGNGSKHLTGDTMRFSSDVIKSIFDPVLERILLLVNTQRNGTMKDKQRKPRAILLVGGLGSNKFLYQRLQAEFPAGDTDVIQPRGAKTWASICRGAAIKGMTYDDFIDQPFPVVTSYISKAHYGMMIKEPFDSSKHAQEDRRICPVRHMDVVLDQMRWYVKKGVDVSRIDPVSLSWELTQPENLPRSSFTIKIFESEANTAPTRKTNEVHECATITFPVRWNSLEVRDGGEGQRYKYVHFDVKMTILGLGKLDFATYVDGRRVAQKDVKVKLGGG